MRVSVKSLILACSLMIITAMGNVTYAQQPKVIFPDPTMNFGRVPQMVTLTHTFWIKSMSVDTIKIVNVFPGCGCTEVPIEDSVIAPGDSLPISITFHSQRFRGFTKKEPTIRLDAVDRLMALTLATYVMGADEDYGALSIMPPGIDVSQFGTLPRRIGKCFVVNNTDQDLELEVTDSTMKPFEIKIPEKIKAGETAEVKIRVKEDKVDQDLEESFTIRAVGINDGVYSIPVTRLYRPDSPVKSGSSKK